MAITLYRFSYCSRDFLCTTSVQVKRIIPLRTALVEWSFFLNGGSNTWYVVHTLQVAAARKSPHGIIAAAACLCVNHSGAPWEGHGSISDLLRLSLSCLIDYCQTAVKDYYYVDASYFHERYNFVARARRVLHVARTNTSMYC